VLVVDDDELYGRAVGRHLKSLGFEFTLAGDGAAGAEAVRHGAFDVVLSDIDMPGMTGIDLLLLVRAHDLDLPVVLMTAGPSVDTAQSAVRHGAFDYLRKPIDARDLARVLERAVRTRRLADLRREAVLAAGTGMLGPADHAGLSVALSRALDGLWLARQPIADRTGQVIAYELLMRSREPALPHPGAVLDAAERLGRLPELGRHCRGLVSEGFEQAPPNVTFFVNLHPQDLLDEGLFAHQTSFSTQAERIVLELTERASLDEVPDLRRRLSTLRSMGFRLALDDLGAGYAGLHSFALLEPEIVKFDMALVRDIHRKPTEQKLIRSMVALCEEMQARVVAEGIESNEERKTLVDLGVHLFQGYLLARPGPGFPGVSWG
jgi:EAL domain-containing protein (putative c-di-GMP-specific phosphodiesterase class I)